MAGKETKKRTRLVRPYPADTLEVAQEVAKAVGSKGSADGEGSLARETLATVLGTTAKSSAFITILNSSAKYGLTQGGYKDEFIRLTARGSSLAAPTRDQERLQALTEAALEPDVFRQFYEAHGGADLPDDTFTKNILQRQFGIQAELTSECLEIIKANGALVGFIKESQGKLRVDLAGLKTSVRIPAASISSQRAIPATNGSTSQPDNSSGKVFVGHWGDPEAARFVTSTLDAFQIPYEYSDVQESDGRPVPASVSEKMHRSSAAILVFADPADCVEGSGEREQDQVQMLYQLGASSALFGDKVVLFKCSGAETNGAASDESSDIRSVLFHEGKYREAGFELIRELHQSGIIRVGV